MKKKLLSAGISFLVWAAIFFTQAALDVSFGWIMLTMFFVSLPLSTWIARRVTGVDPLKELFK